MIIIIVIIIIIIIITIIIIIIVIVKVIVIKNKILYEEDPVTQQQFHGGPQKIINISLKSETYKIDIKLKKIIFEKGWYRNEMNSYSHCLYHTVTSYINYLS